MRRSWALLWVIAPLFPFAACTTFGTDPDPPISPEASLADVAPVDGPTGPDSATVDGGPPGCVDASCGTVVATGQLGVGEIAVDADNVAWTISGQVGFVRRKPHGGALLDVEAEKDPHSLQLFTGGLSFATGVAVHAVTFQGDVHTQALQLAPPNGDPVIAQRRAGDRLLFLRGAGSLLESCPVGEAGCIVIGSGLVGEGLLLEVFPGANRAWVATTARVEAFGLPLSGSQAQPVWPITGVRALAVDGSQVYYLRTGDVGVYASLASAADAPAQPLVMAPAPPSGLAIDGSSLYFTVPAKGVVMRVAKNGGTAVTIATGLPSPTAIAVLNGQVYVALGDGRIVALPAGPP
jgi:hypothetical protein